MILFGKSWRTEVYFGTTPRWVWNLVTAKHKERVVRYGDDPFLWEPGLVGVSVTLGRVYLDFFIIWVTE